MREARPRLSAVGPVIAALLVLLVALSPALLFGQPLSAFGLGVIGVSLFGLGLLWRRRGRAWVRTFGTSLAIIGAVNLVLAVAWPFDWLLANRRAAWFQLTGLAAFAALFVIHAVLNFTQALAP